MHETHQLVVYADVITLVENVHNIQKKAAALLVVSQEVGLEESVKKTKSVHFPCIECRTNNNGES
jgi:hypothetical protein